MGGCFDGVEGVGEEEESMSEGHCWMSAGDGETSEGRDVCEEYFGKNERLSDVMDRLCTSERIRNPFRLTMGSS